MRRTHGEGFAPPLPCMHIEDGEENVGVGGDDHQQSSDHVHTSECEKDAFTQVCVRTRELKNWSGVTEEVMDDIGSTEWQAAYTTCVNHRVHQACCKSPCCRFQADRPGHDQGIKERVAYGHIAVMGHSPKKYAFICGQGYKELHLQIAASKGDGFLP